MTLAPKRIALVREMPVRLVPVRSRREVSAGEVVPVRSSGEVWHW